MNERRVAALVIFVLFIVWGIIEGALGHGVLDQLLFAFIFGVISVTIRGDQNVNDIFRKKENRRTEESKSTS